MNNYIDIESLKSVDEKTRQDPFFIINYFSVKTRSNADYAYLTTDMLKNKHFVFSVLGSNPDIYLLADESLRTLDSFKFFKGLLRSTEYVKYAPKQFFEDKEAVKRSIKDNIMNFIEIPSELRKQPDVMECLYQKLRQSEFIKASEVKKIFKCIDKSYLENKDLMFNLLNQTLFNILPGLPDVYKNDLSLLKSCFLRKTSNVKYFNKELLDDYDVCLDLVKSYDKNIHLKNKLFNVQDFLLLIKNENLTEEVCKILKKEICINYKSFDNEKRANKNVIMNLFSGDEIRLNINYLKMVPIDDLKQELISFAYTKNKTSYYNNNQHSHDPEFKTVQKELEDLLKKYYLRKDLEADLTTNNSVVKKVKI